jgi:hypothetical protein
MKPIKARWKQASGCWRVANLDMLLPYRLYGNEGSGERDQAAEVAALAENSTSPFHSTHKSQKQDMREGFHGL